MPGAPCHLTVIWSGHKVAYRVSSQCLAGSSTCKFIVTLRDRLPKVSILKPDNIKPPKLSSALLFVGWLGLTASGRAQVVEVAAALPAVEPMTITVEPGARQRFAGFGASLGNWGGEYQQLPATNRAALSRMLLA